MAQKVLIMGESGTGKSTSLRNCDPATTAVINPVGKPLPFKNHFEMLNNETDARKIVKYMKEQCAAGKKLLVVDDFQYILAVPYMNRIKETGGTSTMILVRTTLKSLTVAKTYLMML